MAALAVSGKENMNISVVVRIRPLNGVEQSKNEKMCLDYDEKTATILMGNTPLVEKNTFTFDKVFGISTPQDLFYQEVAQNIVSSCFKGINGTLIAYGQTGAGKTWSIEGNKEMPGIIPHACFEIFDTIDRHHHGSPSDTFLVRCSYLEIYNESVYDLLCVKDHEMPAHHNAAKPPPILSVHEDTSKHNFFAAGLTERVVT